jgi:hypothetical protein
VAAIAVVYHVIGNPWSHHTLKSSHNVPRRPIPGSLSNGNSSLAPEFKFMGNHCWSSMTRRRTSRHPAKESLTRRNKAHS